MCYTIRRLLLRLNRVQRAHSQSENRKDQIVRIRVTFKGSRESLQRLPEYLSSCRGIHLDSIKEGRNIVAEGSLQDGELGLAVFLTDVQSTGLLENLVVRWTRIDQLPE